MANRPIIMSPKMVSAIFAEIRSPGTGKIETRRLLYAPRNNGPRLSMLQGYERPGIFYLPVDKAWGLTGWERIQPGDRLWIRETHQAYGIWDKTMEGRWMFSFGHAGIGEEQVRFDGEPTHKSRCVHWGWWGRPAIHMLRQHSRITLHVREVRIERLQAITENAARREGAQLAAEGAIGYGVPAPRSYRHGFVRLWNSLHACPCGWADDPWVVVIRFHPVLGNIDKLSTAVDTAPAA